MKHRAAPRFCVWEITLRCNAACIHCGSSAGSPRPAELDSREALELCDDMAVLGVERVTLSGGEPLLRADWPDIAGRLRQWGKPSPTSILRSSLAFPPKTTRTPSTAATGCATVAW